MTCLIKDFVHSCERRSRLHIAWDLAKVLRNEFVERGRHSPFSATEAFCGECDARGLAVRCTEPLAIRARGISKRFGALLAVDRVDLSVPRANESAQHLCFVH